MDSDTALVRSVHHCLHPQKNRASTLLMVCVVLSLVLRAVSFGQDQPSDSVVFLDASPPFREGTGVSMVQDRDGFLWIIDTWRLLKYDGYTYKRYYNGGYRLFDVPMGLAGIAGGKHGFLCVTANANKVLFIDTHRYDSRVISLKKSGCPGNHELSAVIEDSRGRFWIGCSGGNVFVVDPRRMKVENVFECGRDGLAKSLNSVRALAEDLLGNIWIGGGDGLLRLPSATADGTVYPAHAETLKTLRGKNVAGLLTSRDGRLWVCLSTGMVGWIDPGTMRFNSIPDLPLAPSVFWLRSFVEDLSGGLWIATHSQGLFYWRSSTRTWERHLVYRDPSGKQFAERITNAIVDRGGILWVMTSSRGLLRHLPERRVFRSYTAQGEGQLKLSGEDITAAIVDSKGTLWVGRGSGGLDYLVADGKGFGRFVHNPSDPSSLTSNVVGCISELRNGEIWIGTIRGGISVFQYNTRSFKNIRHRPGDLKSIGNYNVFVIYEDSRGTVWLGHDKGVDKYEPERDSFEPVFRWPEETTGILGSTSAIIKDSKENLWVGTQNKGVLRMNLASGDTTWYRPDSSNKSSLPYEHVTSFFEDTEHRLWVGTTLSLSRFDYDSEKFENYEIVLPRSSLGIGPGAPPPPMKQGIYGIVGDKGGNLWVWLQGGVVARFDIQDHTFQRFGRAEGVVPTAPRPSAFFMDGNGTIYCGGPGGITWFHPDSISLQARPNDAPVVITQFRVLQQPWPLPIDASLPIVLSHDENTCSFEFAMLDYRGPEEYLYEYILEGMEQVWSLSSPERTVTYASIPPGQYRFRVRSANGTGTWSTNEASMILVVHPPFWETLWFRGTLVIAFLAIVYALYRYRLAQMVAVERLRLRIASDLHDEIGSNLGSIALQGQMVTRLFTLPREVQKRVKEIVTLAQDTSQSMRDIVWLINPEHDTFGDLVSRMKEASVKMLEGVEYNFNASNAALDVRLDTEAKRTMLLMYKEVLNNILRHASARLVLIEMCTRDSLMVLRVRDDGIGFAEEQQSNGDGIANMKRRAATLGGTVDIQTKPNNGTTVEIQIPLSHERKSARRQISPLIARKFK